MADSRLVDSAIGAVAGLIAGQAMGLVSSTMYEHEDRLARLREDWARGSKDSHQRAAEKLTEAIGLGQSKLGVHSVAAAIPVGMAAGSAATYAQVRHCFAAPGWLKGLGFGLSLCAIADQGAVPALGLSPGPTAFPWQTHARSIAAHATFGLAVEGLLALADRFRRS